jgi:hypothetical protein
MGAPFRGYPAFALVKETGGSFNMAGAGEDHSTWAPIFTARERAERFLEERALQGYLIKELLTAQSVFEHLIPAKRAGATIVALDPTAKGGERVLNKPIDRFLAELQ